MSTTVSGGASFVASSLTYGYGDAAPDISKKHHHYYKNNTINKQDKRRNSFLQRMARRGSADMVTAAAETECMEVSPATKRRNSLLHCQSAFEATREVPTSPPPHYSSSFSDRTMLISTTTTAGLVLDYGEAEPDISKHHHYQERRGSAGGGTSHRRGSFLGRMQPLHHTHQHSSKYHELLISDNCSTHTSSTAGGGGGGGDGQLHRRNSLLQRMQEASASLRRDSLNHHHRRESSQYFSTGDEEEATTDAESEAGTDVLELFGSRGGDATAMDGSSSLMDLPVGVGGAGSNVKRRGSFLQQLIPPRRESMGGYVADDDDYTSLYAPSETGTDGGRISEAGSFLSKTKRRNSLLQRMQQGITRRLDTDHAAFTCSAVSLDGAAAVSDAGSVIASSSDAGSIQAVQLAPMRRRLSLLYRMQHQAIQQQHQQQQKQVVHERDSVKHYVTPADSAADSNSGILEPPLRRNSFLKGEATMPRRDSAKFSNIGSIDYSHAATESEDGIRAVEKMPVRRRMSLLQRMQLAQQTTSAAATAAVSQDCDDSIGDGSSSGVVMVRGPSAQAVPSVSSSLSSTVASSNHPNNYQAAPARRRDSGPEESLIIATEDGMFEKSTRRRSLLQRAMISARRDSTKLGSGEATPTANNSSGLYAKRRNSFLNLQRLNSITTGSNEYQLQSQVDSLAPGHTNDMPKSSDGSCARRGSLLQRMQRRLSFTPATVEEGKEHVGQGSYPEVSTLFLFQGPQEPPDTKLLHRVSELLSQTILQEKAIRKGTRVHRDRAKARFINGNVVGALLSMRRLQPLEERQANLLKAIGYLRTIETQLEAAAALKAQVDDPKLSMSSSTITKQRCHEVDLILHRITSRVERMVAHQQDEDVSNRLSDQNLLAVLNAQVMNDSQQKQHEECINSCMLAGRN